MLVFHIKLMTLIRWKLCVSDMQVNINIEHATKTSISSEEMLGRDLLKRTQKMSSFFYQVFKVTKSTSNLWNLTPNINIINDVFYLDVEYDKEVFLYFCNAKREAENGKSMFDMWIVKIIILVDASFMFENVEWKKFEGMKF